MLLKSIKLHNFRQFRDQYLEFAPDGRKNVTIILGDNGTGKTTFAQAFTWCLYGETNFSDKLLLNKKVAADTHSGAVAEVSVELCFSHGYVDYTVNRSVSYQKDYTGKFKTKDTSFEIEYKG